MSEEIDEKYLCGVCKGILKNPCSIDCQHVFCYDCLDNLIDKGHHSCPKCRESVDMTFRTEEITLEDEIKKKIIQCTACQQHFRLCDYEKHESSCTSGSQREGGARRMPVNWEKIGPNRHTFTCPACGAKNLTCEGLLKHVNDTHKGEKLQVVCPVCASMPWGNAEQKSGDFVAHITLRHKFEYDRFVDFAKNDEEQLRVAIEKSKMLF